MFPRFLWCWISSLLWLLPGGVTADDIESSRTYGKMYVEPIRVGSFPPVCVAKYSAEPHASTLVQAMRDPERPSILVFCRTLSPDTCRIINSLDASAAFANIPLFVTITEPKGIASAASDDFDVGNYYTPEQAEELVTKYTKVASESGLVHGTVGVAVNRFWRDSIGYQKDDDMIIAYVRGTVLLLESIDWKANSYTQTNAILSRIGKLHRESAAQK